jgi:ribosomal protein L30E
MSEKRDVLGALGLCAKAGKLSFGIPMICEALKNGGKNRPVLVVEASDTSDNSHKRIQDRCRFYGTEILRAEITGAELGAAVGKTTVLGAVGVTDAGLASLVRSKL